MPAAPIPPAVKAALDAGTRASTTLAEALAVDMAALLASLDAGPEAVARLRAAAGQGVVARMALAAALLADRPLAPLLDHPSDTVRGWGAFVIGARPGLGLPARLALIRPLAADAHFGVREWAWLALRPHIAADPAGAIALLAPWTAEADANLRRFASEATRPRGVWCAHLPALRRDPAMGLPILSPLRADPARYVQLSVGNWLNDAAKDRPDWVTALAADWAKGGGGAATARILARGLRSLRPARR